jgi:hypothetical protein
MNQTPDHAAEDAEASPSPGSVSDETRTIHISSQAMKGPYPPQQQKGAGGEEDEYGDDPFSEGLNSDDDFEPDEVMEHQRPPPAGDQPGGGETYAPDDKPVEEEEKEKERTYLEDEDYPKIETDGGGDEDDDDNDEFRENENTATFDGDSDAGSLQSSGSSSSSRSGSYDGRGGGEEHERDANSKGEIPDTLVTLIREVIEARDQERRGIVDVLESISEQLASIDMKLGRGLQLTKTGGGGVVRR